MKSENKKIHFIYLLVIVVLFGITLFLILTNNSGVNIGLDGKTLKINFDFSRFDEFVISDDKSDQHRLLYSQNGISASNGKYSIVLGLNKGEMFGAKLEDDGRDFVLNFDKDHLGNSKYSDRAYELITNYDFQRSDIVDRVETIGDKKIFYSISKDGTITTKKIVNASR